MVNLISSTSEQYKVTRASLCPIVEDITSLKVHQKEKELEIIVQQAPQTVPASATAASASTSASALAPASATVQNPLTNFHVPTPLLDGEDATNIAASYQPRASKPHEHI